MRAEEIRGLSDGDLTGRIAELEREQFNLRFKGGTQPLEDPLRLRVLRKDIARLKTVQHERALGIERAASETGSPATGARKTTAKKGAAKTTAKRATATKSATKSAAKRATKTAAKKTAAKTTTTRATTKTAKKAASKRAGGSSR